jgi:exosortase/archaeosortase
VRRFTQVVFNIGNYQRQLLDDFARDGGVLVQREFSSPRELARLPERVIFNCTGIGAKALFGDGSLVPVRGQTARLIPQPEVDYALIYRGRNLVMVPRRDGLLVQANGEHDFGSADLTLDRAQTVAAVERLAALFT